MVHDVSYIHYPPNPCAKGWWCGVVCTTATGYGGGWGDPISCGGNRKKSASGRLTGSQHPASLEHPPPEPPFFGSGSGSLLAMLSHSYTSHPSSSLELLSLRLPLTNGQWKTIASRYNNSLLTPRDYHLHFKHITHRRIGTNNRFADLNPIFGLAWSRRPLTRAPLLRPLSASAPKHIDMGIPSSPKRPRDPAQDNKVSPRATPFAVALPIDEA
eukprot:scaffold511_cov111-Isochrysis_galbana.AAC.2